ncbi:solute carrier family 49 member 4 homolog [Glandiceps talaboti]
MEYDKISNGNAKHRGYIFDESYSRSYDDERTPLLANGSPGSPINVVYEQRGGQGVYKRRWYILLLFSFTAFTQGLTWNTWGPIADTAKVVLPGWENSDIALLTNWGPITYIITAFVFSWLMDVRGLRVSVVITHFLLMIGTGIRCIPLPVHLIKWTMHTGQIFIGLAGPVAMAAPTLISATWFPLHERTTATAISTVFSYFGVAASFLIGPLIVKDLPDGNNTGYVINCDLLNNRFVGIDNPIHHEEINQIWHLLYIECAWEGLLFLMTIIYFPAKPPLPPSISAGLQRMEYKTGIFQLTKKWAFLCLGLAYGISCGVYSGWGSVVDIILKPHGVSQSEAGWIGFWSNIVGAGGGLGIARIVDCCLGKHIKKVLLLLYVGGVLAFGWYLLLCYEIIESNTASLYVSIIIVGFVINGAIPLFYEAAVESTYPIAEGITTITMTWLNNLFGLIFFAILMIPSTGTSWMNWCMMGAIGISFPLLLLFREKYNRLSVDLVPEVKHDTEK